MSVASRLRRLLEVHGHSLAKAQEVTGVSRETIRRMVNGEQSPKMAIYLRQIAVGYGIDEHALLDGATPKGEFEWSIRHATPAHRLAWLMAGQPRRVKLTIDFLRNRCPQAIPLQALAAAARMTEGDLLSLLERWEICPPDRRTADDLARALHALTGISLAWFKWGGFSDTWRDGTAGLTRVSRWASAPGQTKSLVDLVSSTWD